MAKQKLMKETVEDIEVTVRCSAAQDRKIPKFFVCVLVIT